MCTKVVWEVTLATALDRVVDHVEWWSETCIFDMVCEVHMGVLRRKGKI